MPSHLIRECSQCGEKFNVNIIQCPRCGSQQWSEIEIPNTNNTRYNKPSSTVIIIIAIAAILGALAAIIIASALLSHNTPTSPNTRVVENSNVYNTTTPNTNTQKENKNKSLTINEDDDEDKVNNIVSQWTDDSMYWEYYPKSVGENNQSAPDYPNGYYLVGYGSLYYCHEGRWFEYYMPLHPEEYGPYRWKYEHEVPYSIMYPDGVEKNYQGEDYQPWFKEVCIADDIQKTKIFSPENDGSNPEVITGVLEHRWEDASMYWDNYPKSVGFEHTTVPDDYPNGYYRFPSNAIYYCYEGRWFDYYSPLHPEIYGPPRWRYTYIIQDDSVENGTAAQYLISEEYSDEFGNGKGDIQKTKYFTRSK